MTLDMKRNWANQPLGMRDVYPEQAKRRRQLENQLLTFFEQRGYDMVSSGAFEYVDTLLRGRTPLEAEDWVQLFDPSGRAVALRPDMTPSIARMAAPLIAGGRQEVRWCYAERVYRRTNDPASLSWLSGKAAESTQVGVEWIGQGDVDTDCELIAVCQHAMQSLKLSDWQMVVSHALFAPAFLKAFGTPEGALGGLLGLLSQGDYVGFRRQFAQYHIDSDVLTLLGSLNPYEPDSFSPELKGRFEGQPSGDLVLSVWGDLLQFADLLKQRKLNHQLTFDLTLHRELAYYTGMVFEVFTTGVGAPIALGGRYDNLLTEFGAASPAVGFTFEVERLLSVVTDGEWLTPSAVPVARLDAATGETQDGRKSETTEQREGETC
ncbi:ATP phosphoribosyltransferase regulatory subunit [Alicyclobacillus tolerans]|uniref:ATP phosphoribosyltransferase regulatory subunit n=1 Tax=Alicyclobacillus tolerans TaxID=90970 RepID=UPI001F1806A4|nr:ATP phosphoribosyltransferase regulatory subunit [Alicyclobacillus tolerans]MCF8564041.1 ATP phosphoribosyltransferase regulatory subunit [Alicyclobacillus tolerans]